MKPLTATHYKIRRIVGALLLAFVPILLLEKLAHVSSITMSITILMMIGAIYSLVILDMSLRGKIKAKGAKRRFNRMSHPFD